MSFDHYDRCIEWVDRAGPADRALAWLGLGHALAVLYRASRGRGREPNSRPRNEQEWTELFRQTGKRLSDESLSWRVPANEDDFDLLDRVLALPPRQIAQMVRRFLVHSPYVGPPMRVRLATPFQHNERWITPLLQPPAPRLAISLRLNRAPRNPNLPRWPLRLGALEHGPFAPYTEWVAQIQGLTEFAVPVSLGRRHDSCDLLLYPGDATDLMRDLTHSPLPVRACVVVLGKASSPDELRSVLSRLQGSGHAIWGELGLGRAFSVLASLADRLAHGLSFDAAWSGSFPLETPPWLSDELADLTLYTMQSTRLRRIIDTDARSGREERRRGREQFWKSLPEPRTPREDPYDLARRLATLAKSPRPSSPKEQLEGAQRFLQQQSYNLLAGVESPAEGGFFIEHAVRIRVRIGPPAEGWQGYAEPFTGLLVEPEGTVHLRVCLVEPDQLDEPMWGELILPQTGNSSLHTFEFLPRAVGSFEARLVILHRGRVIQTALFLTQVRSFGTPHLSAEEATPRLAALIRPRGRIDDLHDRTAFDLAIVENHVPSGTARTVALSRSRAWVTGGALVAHFSDAINKILSETGYAPDSYKSITDPAFLDLLRDIALIGIGLRDQLMVNSLERQDTLFPNIEYIQLVTAREGPTFPLEFIYDYEAPDRNALVCPSWASSAASLRCPAGCGGGTRRVICPRGFWGISKVIERHQTSSENATSGQDFFLQSEPDRVTGSIQLGNKFLLATSHLLNDSHEEIVARMHALGAASALHAKDWNSWETLVKKENPRLILCMPHVEGDTALAKLEINNDLLESLAIRREHVAPLPEGKPPLVFLLGCDTAGAGRDYSPHVSTFRARGAAIVVATKCLVDADQAAQAALILASELFENRSGKTTLGECMRDFRRRALAEHLLLALGVVAYGDADWHITP